MESIVKQCPFGEVIIIRFKECVTFKCSAINLDAVYDIESGKIKGKGSKACRDFILKEANAVIKGAY